MKRDWVVATLILSLLAVPLLAKTLAPPKPAPVPPPKGESVGEFRQSWRVLEPRRRSLARAALKRVAGTPSLSRDVGDIVQRALAES